MHSLQGRNNIKVCFLGGRSPPPPSNSLWVGFSSCSSSSNSNSSSSSNNTLYPHIFFSVCVVGCDRVELKVCVCVCVFVSPITVHTPTHMVNDVHVSVWEGRGEHTYPTTNCGMQNGSSVGICVYCTHVSARSAST